MSKKEKDPEMNYIKAARELLEEIAKNWPEDPEPPKDFAMLGIQKLKEWEAGIEEEQEE